MFPFLHAAEHGRWHHLVTDDESLFFLNIAQRRMWTLSRDGVVTKPRLDIQSKTIMLTIMWNASGLYIVDRVLNDTKMNSDYFVTKIHIAFAQAIFRRRRAPYQK
jgi:hypothetical protein